MNALGRLLLRFLVVPFGAFVAIVVAVMVVIVGDWHAFLHAVTANPQAQESYFVALMLFGPWIALVLSVSTLIMLTPGAIGILIAEAFAIRAWWFHIANGIVSAWVGWSLVDRPGEQYPYFTDPKIVLAAGFGAGLAYWLIAGWSAGFTKPVLAREQPVITTPPPPAQKETRP
jgi:hypothetical protein